MIKTIYLVHHSHMDIGYTDLAHEVRNQQLHYLDEALEIWSRSQKAGGTEFKWTCESSWAIKEYLEMRSARRTELLLAALKSGAIELMGLFAQPLTELASPAESIESIRYAAELGRKHGFPVRCAMLNDIGGYMGRLPSVLNGWDIPYFVAGIGSYQVHLPWAAEMPHLFYLEDRAGHRTLIWNLGIDRTKTPQTMEILDAVYYMGGSYLMKQFAQDILHRVKLDEGPAIKVSQFTDVWEALNFLLRRLEAERYPYEDLMLQYGADNFGPDQDLPLLVDRFNDQSKSIKIVLTTPRVFFEHMVQKHGENIPVYRGVITDPWNTRAIPQPRPLAVKRQSQFLLSAGEARAAHAASLGGNLPDSALVERTYNSLHYYTDHTCGLREWAWQTDFQGNCRAGTFDRYRHSWRDKAFYADAAFAGAFHLDRVSRERVLSDNSGLQTAIVVWNDLPKPHSGAAWLQFELPRVNTLKAMRHGTTGLEIPIQRISKREYLLKVTDVPALGYQVLIPEWDPSPTHYVAPTEEKPKGFILESEFLSLAFDSATGQLRSIRSKEDNREWIDQNSPHGCGEFLYGCYEGVEETSAQSGMGSKICRHFPTAKLLSFKRGLQGPLFQSYIVEREFQLSDRSVIAEEEFILHACEPKIDFRVRLDKPETALKESCYVAFPLDITNARFRCDQTFGWIEPAKDLLPASMQDCFHASRWADISNDAFGATLISPDAPLFEAGRIRTGDWKNTLPFEEESSHIFGWVYHNLAQTDNPIWQDVLQTFRYTLVFHGSHPFEVSQCDADSELVNLPLRTHITLIDIDNAPMSTDFLEVQPSSIQLVYCRAGDVAGEVLICLEERAGKNSIASLRFAQPVKAAWSFEDFFQKDPSALPTSDRDVSANLAAYQILTLRIQLAL